MTTTPDNTATTWRDLADQLTPEQIAYIEHWESRPAEPPKADGSPRSVEQQRTALLFSARQFAAANTAAIAYSDIAPPAGAVDLDTWTAADGDGDMRFFTGTTRAVGSINVSILGWQYSDGRAVRTVRVESTDEYNDGDMPAAQARLVAAALIEAAGEMERLS